MTDVRESVVARVRKLRALAAGNTTEYESMAATLKASELMAEAGLDELDLEMTQATAEVGTAKPTPRDDLWADIAHHTNTSLIFVQGGRSHLRIYGAGAGPELAAYVIEVLNREIDRQVRAWCAVDPTYRRKRKDRVKKRLRADFTVGLVQRLRRMVRERFAGRSDDEARRRAHTYRDRQNPGSGTRGSAGHDPKNFEALSAGDRAGRGVQLLDGVGRGRSAGLIGHRPEADRG